MKMKLTKKLTIGSMFVGVALASTVAFAAWTTNGSGSGYAKATSAADLTTVRCVGSTFGTSSTPPERATSCVKIHNPNELRRHA